MNHQTAAIINYAIGVFLMIMGLMVIQKKKAADPNMKIYGLSLKAFTILMYVGMTCFLLLILAVATGLE